MHLTFRDLKKSAKGIDCLNYIKSLNGCSELAKKHEEALDYEKSFENKCIICGSIAYLDTNNTCAKCKKEFPVKKIVSKN